MQYVTKAEAIKINDTTLAMQTIAFVQELSEAVRSLPNVCVVVTLPSSRNEQFDEERFAILDDKLRKVAGRTRDTVTPVSDMDIPRIIRQRLFSSNDDEIRDRAEGIVKDFVDYCKNENLIPEGMQPSEYREAFLGSYRSCHMSLMCSTPLGNNITFPKGQGRLAPVVHGGRFTGKQQQAVYHIGRL